MIERTEKVFVSEFDVKATMYKETVETPLEARVTEYDGRFHDVEVFHLPTSFSSVEGLEQVAMFLGTLAQRYKGI